MDSSIGTGKGSGGIKGIYMELMTVEEVASKLRVKRSWVYTHADELGVYHAGKYLRFSWSRVLECLERGLVRWVIHLTTLCNLFPWNGIRSTGNKSEQKA